MSDVSRVQIDILAYFDAHEVLAANQASKEYHAPWASPPLDTAGFEQWYGQMLTGPNLSFVIREATGKGIVGVVNISQIVWGVFRSAYLGYYGYAAFAGRGYMKEGLSLVVQRAFNDLRLHRLEANIQPDNVRSIGLVASLGFVKEGFSRSYLKIEGKWCDHERWAVVNAETN